MPGHAEISGSGLLSWRSQTHTWTYRGLWFLPIPSEVRDLQVDPQRFCLRSTPLEVPGTHLDPQRSLVLGLLPQQLLLCTYFCGVHSLGLLWCRLLSQNCFNRCPWSRPTHSHEGSWVVPGPAKASCSGLLLQRFQIHTQTHRSLVPAYSLNGPYKTFS